MPPTPTTLRPPALSPLPPRSDTMIEEEPSSPREDPRGAGGSPAEQTQASRLRHGLFSIPTSSLEPPMQTNLQTWVPVAALLLAGPAAEAQQGYLRPPKA